MVSVSAGESSSSSSGISNAELGELIRVAPGQPIIIMVSFPRLRMLTQIM